MKISTVQYVKTKILFDIVNSQRRTTLTKINNDSNELLLINLLTTSKL